MYFTFIYSVLNDWRVDASTLCVATTIGFRPIPSVCWSALHSKQSRCDGCVATVGNSEGCIESTLSRWSCECCPMASLKNHVVIFVASARCCWSCFETVCLLKCFGTVHRALYKSAPTGVEKTILQLVPWILNTPVLFNIEYAELMKGSGTLLPQIQ